MSSYKEHLSSLSKLVKRALKEHVLVNYNTYQIPDIWPRKR